VSRLHEPRHGERGLHPLAHAELPQRGKGIEKMQPSTASQVHRQKSRNEGAVEEIHRHRARQDVSGPPRFIVGERLIAAGIKAGCFGAAGNFGQDRRIAKPEVQALGSDRWKDMAGLTHQRHATVREAIGREAGKGEDGALSDRRDRTQQALESLLQLCGEEIGRQILEARRLFGALDPYDARRGATQRQTDRVFSR